MSLPQLPDANEVKQQQITGLILAAISRGEKSISVPTMSDHVKTFLTIKNYKVEYSTSCTGCSGDYGTCYCSGFYRISWDL